MRLFFLLFLAAAVAVLSACAPIYKTEYSYVPPHSNIANMCVSQCNQAKSNCQQLCELRNENCRSRSRQDAMYEYEIYKRDMQSQNKKIEKNISDFDRGGYSCNVSCNCTPSFNSCYSACGGKVMERQVCIAFCDKK